MNDTKKIEKKKNAILKDKTSSNLSKSLPKSLKSLDGYFGDFGGCYIPEILYVALSELEVAYKTIFQTKAFQKELRFLHKNFISRPTPLIHAKNASKLLKNNIYLKFEGLANTGAHKINNALAQVLLAKKMGKKKVIAETGAGQHGLATASACAYLGMECVIYMGSVDIKRQRPNVFIMERFGAKVVSVESGEKTLKDAVNEALREWSKDSKNIFYVLGSALGPSPYPDMVRDAQSIISKELLKQTKAYFKGKPDYVIACVGGGSNAMGVFSHYIESKKVHLVGVEAGGLSDKKGEHAMRMNGHAKVGIAQGYKSFFLQDKNGQLELTHSISAGLDYGGISPQLANLGKKKRVEFIYARDKEALYALEFFAKNEGILPALESAHALAGCIKVCKKVKDKNIVVNVSGRGDKDIFITAKVLDKDRWKAFLEAELESMKD
ncbi:tryptophan synthase subunit beta [Helicobacter sp. 11S02629-2]|uniref:tryptophan synthase subunit beta n=1 Tax=Helicobacter sp. 11S02629-2 TaxID=1476195 RepID=UPI000BA7C9F4|nr:tryptophan synthase subunit beta [Helicobacter sp. 11S02629-2]